LKVKDQPLAGLFFTGEALARFSVLAAGSDAPFLDINGT
jgi:hypothetical protein